MVNTASARSNIERWWNGLTIEERIEHVIKAGKCRWLRATPYDRARNAAVFRKHCMLSRRDALRRLEKARLIAAQRRASRPIDLASMPRL